MNAFLFIILILIAIELIRLRKRVAQLEKLKETVRRQPVEPAKPSTSSASHRSDGQATAEVKPRKRRKTGERSPSISEPLTNAPASSPAIAEGEIPRDRKPDIPAPPTQAASSGNSLAIRAGYLRDFFTTGNVVLKVGMVVLFFGVSFLLKYAAQRNMIPIEVRLAGVALGGVTLLITGWVLARKREGFGLVLQGGGIGILYLTVFASARLYDLLPMSFSFFLMSSLVVLSGILAVLQNARPLAVFGTCGGFLAPVLLSSGTGSHVLLFSYYAFLNGGIVGIAWFKAWRELNLIGFFFTFIISAIWGYQYYQPEYFTSTEPFLLLFFFFYVAISILFAHRQPVNLRGFVDGPLVFGLPIAFFGMQASLVGSHEYGTAFSALGLGSVYLAIASLLWRHSVEGMRTLTESFLALAIVFGSLAIPFALDGHLTASAWALEGGAMVWVGLRQQRVLARNFGILLQVGAAISFLAAGGGLRPDGPWVLNETTLGGAFIALAALFSSFQLNRQRQEVRPWEEYSHLILLGWGMLWWCGIGLWEVDSHAGYPLSSHLALLFLALTALAVNVLCQKLAWQELKYPLLGFLPVLVFAALAGYDITGDSLFFRGMGLLAWPVCFGVGYCTLWMMEKLWGAKTKAAYHTVSLWLLIFMATSDAARGVGELPGGDVWWITCLAVVPGVFILALLRVGSAIQWPVAAYRSSYLDQGIALPLLFLVLWSLGSNFIKGDPAPLHYIPFLNPLTITQIFVFLVFIYWLRENSRLPGSLYAQVRPMALWAGLGGLIFLWLNGTTARLVHYYFAIPFSAHSLYDSVIMQSAISILWSVLALTATVWANHKGAREVWLGGALLLACVVGKLFLVDLSGTGTIARIVSFLAVGILMLLIGYFSPLPPKEELREQEVSQP